MGKPALTKEKRLELLLLLGTDKHSPEILEKLARAYCEEWGGSVQWAKRRTLRTSDVVKYLSRLYLCAKGDIPSVDGLRVAHNETALKVCALIPDDFGLLYEKNTPSPEYTILRYEGERDGMMEFSTGAYWVNFPEVDFTDENTKRLACSRVFLGLCQILQFGNYDIDKKTLLPVRKEPDFMDFTINEIVNGNVAACAHCGAPIYTGKRTNTSPFCNRGHKQRYREAALRMFKKGATRKEVMERFTHIQPDAIEKWTR